jgi:hypothetical protein
MLNSGFIDVHLAMANSEIKNESVNNKIGEEGSIAIIHLSSTPTT